jgi:hypothetical protein
MVILRVILYSNLGGIYESKNERIGLVTPQNITGNFILGVEPARSVEKEVDCDESA